MNIDLVIVLKFAVMAGCIFFSAVFSGSETGMFAINKIKLQALSKRGKRGRRVAELLGHPERLIISILFGNMLVNVFSTTISEGLIRDMTGLAPGNIYINLLTVFIMTFLILIFGEITPKTIAIKNPVKIALTVCRFIHFIYRSTYLFYLVIRKISDFLINLFSRFISYQPSVLTEGELKMAIELGITDGSIERKEEDFLKRVIEYTKTKVKEVMTPRKDVVLVSRDIPYRELMQLIEEKRFSRIPVYDKRIDDIKGFIYTKDLIMNQPSVSDSFDWMQFLRKPYFVPETKSASSLLREFRKKKIHIALVVDEYGGLAGLVSLEDILEEIFGEIFDREEKSSNYIRRLGSNRYKVGGRMEIDYFNALFKTDIDSETNITISGFIMETLGRIPRQGDKVEVDDLTFVIGTMKGTEIIDLFVEKI